jgi:hypothetical protein
MWEMLERGTCVDCPSTLFAIAAVAALLGVGSGTEYLCAENAGASALIANRTAIGGWESFDLITH